MLKNIVIIGAGSTGLATALELAKRVSDKYHIIVLEKQIAGAGQTGQCCGLVRHFYNAKEMAFSAHESYLALRRLGRSKNRLQYVRKGLLVLNSLDQSQAMQDNVQLLQSLGIEAQYLEEQAIKALYPDLNVTNTCAGYDPQAGYLNPVRTIGYLLDQCRQHGVEIRENCPVIDVRTRGAGFIVATEQDTIEAIKVCNATAAATNTINRFLDLKLPVKVINITNCFYRLPLQMRNTQIAIADFVNLFYLIPHPEFVDVSSVALDLNQQIAPHNAGELLFRLPMIKQYFEQISQRLPDFSHAISLGGFDSCIDITPDYYPIVGQTKLPNYYVASGFSGTGYKHFPVLGKLLAESILETSSTYPELAAFFNADRFDGSAKKRGQVSDSYFVMNGDK